MTVLRMKSKYCTGKLKSHLWNMKTDLFFVRPVGLSPLAFFAAEKACKKELKQRLNPWRNSISGLEINPQMKKVLLEGSNGNPF